MLNWKIAFFGIFHKIEMACKKEQLLSLEGKLYFSEVFHKTFFVSAAVDLLKLEGFVDV